MIFFYTSFFTSEIFKLWNDANSLYKLSLKWILCPEVKKERKFPIKIHSFLIWLHFWIKKKGWTIPVTVMSQRATVKLLPGWSSAFWDHLDFVYFHTRGRANEAESFLFFLFFSFFLAKGWIKGGRFVVLLPGRSTTVQDKKDEDV